METSIDRSRRTTATQCWGASSVALVVACGIAAALAGHSTAEAAETGSDAVSPWSYSGTAAAISVVGALLGAVVSAFLARWLARRAARETFASEYKKRQSELALKITAMIAEDKSATRRFAVGIIKNNSNGAERGKVHFIPMNSRVTVGRDEENDIVISDVGRTVSRFHCGFVSEQHDVFIEDYSSRNGTWVNDSKIETQQKLRNGDKIKIGPFDLQFQKVHENKILMQ